MKNAGRNTNSGTKTLDDNNFESLQVKDGDGLALCNRDFQLQYFNPAFEHIYKKVSGRCISKHDSLVFTPLFNSYAEGVKILEQVVRGASMEWPLLASGSGLAGVSLRLEPSRGKNGDIQGVCVLLRESAPSWATNHLNFKAMLESSGDAVILFSPEGKPMYASPSVTDVLGYTQDEILQLDIYSAVHPEDLAGNQKVMEKAIINPGIPIKGHVSRIMHKDGTYHWYDATVVNLLNDPAVGGIVDNIREVSGNMAAPALPPKTNSLYEALAGDSSIGVWELDIQSKQYTRNLHHDQLFGYKDFAGSWTPETFFNHIPTEERSFIRKKFYQSVREGVFDFETRIVWADQSVHWIKLKGKAIKGADGNDKIAGTIADVTEIHNTREALRISEDRLRKIIDNLPDGIVIADPKGDPIYWNPAALSLHGFSTRKEGKRQLSEFLKLFKLYNEYGTAMPFREWPLPRLLRNEPVKSLKVSVSSLKNGWKKIFRYGGGKFQDVYGKDVYFLTISEVSGKQANDKSIKRDEEKLWEAFHLSTMPMLISRKSDGICLDLNKSAEDLLGFCYDEYTGKPALSLNFTSGESHEAFCETFNKNSKQYTEQEITIIVKGKSMRLKIFLLDHISLGEEECRLSLLIRVQGKKHP